MKKFIEISIQPEGYLVTTSPGLELHEALGLCEFGRRKLILDIVKALTSHDKKNQKEEAKKEGRQ